MIDVNIKGVFCNIAAVLPIMRKEHAGHIINMSSIAGHKVAPGGTVCCATKFAVRAISEGVRLEDNGEIRCTNISPGAVATELTDHITDADIARHAKKLYEDAIDAAAIARAIVFAVEQPADVDANEIIVRPTRQSM